MSRKAESAGAVFERWLEITHIRYREEGRALVEKQHVPARPLFREGRMQWTPTGKGLPDYGGFLFGGRSLMFEAKSTAQKSRWGFPADRRHQYEYLLLARSFGCLAFYLIHWSTLDAVRLYMAETLPAWGGKLTPADGIQICTDNGWADWLTTIEEQYGRP